MNKLDKDFGPTPSGDESDLSNFSSASEVTLDTTDTFADEKPLPAQSRRNFLKVVMLAAGTAASTACGQVVVDNDLNTVRTHTVLHGESLHSLSRKYGYTTERLKACNRLDSDMIVPGQKLIIPTNKSNQYIDDKLIADRSTIPSSARNNPEQEALILNSADSYPLLQPYMSGIAKPKISSRWKNVILHHSGTAVGSAAIFDRYHRHERKMPNGLAYHFVIGNGTGSKIGEVETSERWQRQIHGGHVRSSKYNSNSIGICLVGNFQEKIPSPRQRATMMELVEYLSDMVGSKQLDILLHRDIQSTICPGKFFPEQLIKDSVA